MRVLDLFHGTGSATAAFVKLGHEVVSVDLDPACNATMTGDLSDKYFRGEVFARGPFDFVWASPPCERFSVAAIGKNWKDGAPTNLAAELADTMVSELVEILRRHVRDGELRYWIMENPRGMLRTRPHMLELERRTVTYCRLGDTRMKPTDLWGSFPPSLVLPRPCQNGDPCHEAAPRGARTGTQGITGYLNRSRVPFALSLLVALSVESAVLERRDRQGSLRI